MAAIARLGAVTLDTDDPARLSAFYGELLDLEVLLETEDMVVMKGAGILLCTVRVADHRPPDWPGGGVPKQLHLELAVDDLDVAEAAAVAIGARRPEEAPTAPTVFRVLIDPAGHPFCLTILIPD